MDGNTQIYSKTHGNTGLEIMPTFIFAIMSSKMSTVRLQVTYRRGQEKRDITILKLFGKSMNESINESCDL